MGKFQPYFFCYNIESTDFISKLSEFILNITNDYRIPRRKKIKAKLLKKINEILEENERIKKMEEEAAEAKAEAKAAEAAEAKAAAADRRKKIGLAVTATDAECSAREKKIADDEAVAAAKRQKEEAEAEAEADRLVAEAEAEAAEKKAAAEKRAAEERVAKAGTTGKLTDEDELFWVDIKVGLEDTKSHYYKLLEQYNIIPGIYLPVYMSNGYVGLNFDNDMLLVLNVSILESFKNVIASSEVPEEFDRGKLLSGLTIGINELKDKYDSLSESKIRQNQKNLEYAAAKRWMRYYWMHRKKAEAEAEAEAFAIAPEILQVDGLSDQYRLFRKDKDKVEGAAHYLNSNGNHLLSERRDGNNRLWKFTDGEGFPIGWIWGIWGKENNVPMGINVWKIEINGAWQETSLNLTALNDLEARFAAINLDSTSGGRSNIIIKRKSQKTKNNKHYKSTHKKTVNKNKESKTLRKKKRR